MFDVAGNTFCNRSTDNGTRTVAILVATLLLLVGRAKATHDLCPMHPGSIRAQAIAILELLSGSLLHELSSHEQMNSRMAQTT